MVGFVVAVVGKCALRQLLVSDILEDQKVRLVLVLTVVKAAARGAACLREELLTRD